MQMDELIEFNTERWNELSREGVEFGRPWLDLTTESARERVDPEGMLPYISGKDDCCWHAVAGSNLPPSACSAPK